MRQSISTTTWVMAISGAPSKRNALESKKPIAPMEIIAERRLLVSTAMSEPTIMKKRRISNSPFSIIFIRPSR
jgi:hypothetical protein